MNFIHEPGKVWALTIIVYIVGQDLTAVKTRTSTLSLKLPEING